MLIPSISANTSIQAADKTILVVTQSALMEALTLVWNYDFSATEDFSGKNLPLLHPSNGDIFLIKVLKGNIYEAKVLSHLKNVMPST